MCFNVDLLLKAKDCDGVFVGNDPVNWIDPLGLRNWGQIGVGIGTIIVGGGQTLVGGGLVGLGIFEAGGGGPIGAVAGIHTIGLGGIWIGGGLFTAYNGWGTLMEGWNEPEEGECE